MGTIRISVKRKPLGGGFTKLYLDHFPPPSKKKYIPRDFGILTASNKSLFIGLQMLLTSIAHSYDVITLVYDTGMTPEQVAWCQRQPGVTVKPFEITKRADHVHYDGAWFKPFYVMSSPFKHTVWIDADAMVIGDLTELIDCSRYEPLFTTDHSLLQTSTLNPTNLYNYLPISAYKYDIPPYINTGVFVMCKRRDRDILEDWCRCVDEAYAHKHVADSIACWDQGACKWALQKNRCTYLIVPDKKFNYPARIRHCSFKATSTSAEYWFQSLRPKEPCTVLHWMGSPKPWKHWGNMIDLDLTSLNTA